MVLLFTGSVLGAAAERHPDDTAGECYEQGMMVFIQLQSQNPPVLLTLNVTPGHRQEADYDDANMDIKRFRDEH